MITFRTRLLIIASTCFGLGYTPVAPGTAGALLGVIIFLIITAAAPESLHALLIGLSLGIVSVLTVALGPWAERFWKKEDPGTFVLDEVAGFLLTVFLFRQPDLFLTVFWAFLFTRVIDILKVPPARQLEGLPHGWGILADDLCASVYAAAALHVLAWSVPGMFGRSG